MNISLQKGVDFQYQAVQKVGGKLIILVVNDIGNKEKEWILEQSKSYFKEDLELTIFGNQKIHTKKGKLKDFITEID